MDIKKMIDEYFEWLKENYKIEKEENYGIIHTPFTYSNFDLVDIFVTKKNNEIILSDDGDVLNNLYISGLDFKKSKTRKETLENFLHIYGLEINDDEEIIKVTNDLRFSQDKHTFIQGLLAIDDMFLTINTKVKSYFLEDVKIFFENEKIFASPNISIKGKSKMEHHFDFLLNKNENHNERLIKVINNIGNIDKLKSIMYSFKDIEKDNRKTENIIIYNDLKELNKDSLDALEYENILIYPWSNKENWGKNLRA